MESEAREHRKRELEERRKKLEALKAQNATRSKENAERLRREKTSQEEANRKLIQTIIKETPVNNNENIPLEPQTKVEVNNPPMAILEMQAGLAEVSIQATPKETYSQCTQTEMDEDGLFGESLDVLVPLRNSIGSPLGREDSGMASPGGRSGISPRSSSFRSKTSSPISPNESTSSMKALSFNEQTDEEIPIKLSETEVQQLISSDELISFISRKSLIVERALGESIIFDPTAELVTSVGLGEEQRSEEVHVKSFDKSSNSLIKVTTLFDGASHYGNTTSAKRPISEVRWSPHRPEILASSYGASYGTSEHTESGGVVMLWSMALPGRPERKLSTHSPVLSLLFDPDDPNLLFGGTYSGQVVVWDVRATSSLPIRRTALGQSHTHPVFSMSSRRHSTSSGWSLVTASSDGLVCEFDPMNLLEPTLKMPLSFCPPQQTASTAHLPVSVSCLSLCSSNEESLADVALVGSESGDVFMAKIDGSHTSALKKEDRGLLSTSDSLGEGHHGLVTGLSVHPHAQTGHRKSTRLAISSGVDWSTKLWSFHLPQLSDSTAAAASIDDKSKNKMLCDFRGPYEQVTDVEWSPVHPSLFATGNGAGQVSLYDLTYSLEEPRLSPLAVSGGCALTKLRWSADGRRIAVGDLDGMLRLISVSNDVADTKPEAMNEFDKVITRLI